MGFPSVREGRFRVGGMAKKLEKGILLLMKNLTELGCWVFRIGLRGKIGMKFYDV